MRLSQNTVDGTLAAASGQLAKGAGLINASIHASREQNNFSGQAAGLDQLGELYFAILRGEPKPSLSVVLGNLWFLARTVPRAAKLVRATYEELRALADRMDAPSYHAKALLRLGQLDARKGQTQKSRELLKQARAIAIEAGAKHTLREIEVELNSAAA